MESRELRIGNYVNWIIPFSNEYSPKEVDIKILSLINNDSDICKPIPLTEEWLLKFGFEKIIVENYPIYIFNGFMVEVYTDCCVICYNNTEITKIKFVHSLQNLYFSIKLKELLCDNI